MVLFKWEESDRQIKEQNLREWWMPKKTKTAWGGRCRQRRWRGQPLQILQPALKLDSWLWTLWEMTFKRVLLRPQCAHFIRKYSNYDGKAWKNFFVYLYLRRWDILKNLASWQKAIHISLGTKSCTRKYLLYVILLHAPDGIWASAQIFLANS